MAPKKAERVHTHKPVKARPTGDPPPTKKDPTVERLRQLQVWQVAYCKDVSKPLSHKIVHRGLAEGVTMCGRAYTVEGPDVYIDGLERISPGEVYVHAGCNDSDSVFSPGWTHAYLGPRGAAGAVIDGGVYKSYECHKAACPVFSRFTSPSVATNLPSAPSIGKPVTIGGVIINPGDIIMGDHDGCLVVPQECEADLMRGLERFLEGNGMFGKVAAKGLAKGIAMSEHPALEDMFRRKYKAPNSYWRDYEAWWAQWKDSEWAEGLTPQSDVGTAAFYSGKNQAKKAKR